MRCNRHELMALAVQPSQRFDREGVLLMRERQDGFFRRSEGWSLRWFRLRGNLLFYLKGPEPWSAPLGFIVLGQHEIKLQPQDEEGFWPFQLIWENGARYSLGSLQDSDRTLWINAIEMAPYEHISSELAVLQDRLNRIRPVIDISTYRQQKGIVPDMNEIPLCELALSCDNLLCDTHGSPPSPLLVVYVKFHRGLCVRYGATEIVDSCSNPCFSKTIMFRACDGLTGEAIVRLVVYDVKERVSETTVAMGFTAVKLSTIQEAQRLRVALLTKDNMTAGFVTINGWSLEQSYIETSPNHNSDRISVDLPQKLLCHRRSQSLPPRLGLKLKFPSYGTIFKQNFVNSLQVTYRFHSGLGGDITVHEIMAEPKVCYQIPIQLLEIYILRERELLEELLSVGEICGQWASQQLDLIGIHVNLLKQYGHSKQRLTHVDTPYFKASSKKDEASLEFAPNNLHLQRMWVHNDTLNKTGFHDTVTAGAFAAHTHASDRNGGLIRLVQQVKDINSYKMSCCAVPNKMEADYDNVVAMRRVRDDIVHDLDRMVVMLQAKQGSEIVRLIEEIKTRLRSFIALWDPHAVEESFSYITTFPNNETLDETMTAVLQYTEHLSLFETAASESEYSTSSASSNNSSPTVDFPPRSSSLSSSVPNICPYNCSLNHSTITEESELQFDNDYFKPDRVLNSSFRSVKSAKFTEGQGCSFDSAKLKMASLQHDFKSTSSLEHVSFRGLMDSAKGNNKQCPHSRRLSQAAKVGQLDAQIRKNNLVYLKAISDSVEESLLAVYEAVMLALDSKAFDLSDELDDVRTLMENAKTAMEATLRWMRVAHAATRLRCESVMWARENAALQTRRDTCFSQALTTVTAGLVCWLCSVSADVVVKVLSSGLGPLCGFEGLLSLYASEKAMWGDMVVAIEDLQTVEFTLVKAGHSNSSIPQLTGARGALMVNLPVSESLYSKFMSKEHLTFTITAVFFNIGINEKASLAEALGETTPQYHSNCDNLDRLNKYYHKYSKTLHDSRAPSSSRTKPLEEVMENLRIAVHKKTPKNIEVLHLAALATRLMNGIRLTSCKSAKDRTGMAVTLEQCSILTSEYHLAEHEEKKALEIMRSEGCRRENTFKNIGVRKYAFTKKQVMALPEDYRPPAGTYGATQT